MCRIHYLVDRLLSMKSVLLSDTLVFMDQITRRHISDNRHFLALKYLPFENH